MQVYNSPAEFKKNKFTVVTNGTFDGVHLGHKKLLDRLKLIAKENNGETVLITFWPHPRLVLYPDQPLFLINTLEEKIKLLEQAGIDHLIKIPFTKEFSQLTSIEFVNEILINQIGTDMLVIGYNHRFGKNREGSFEHLQKKQEDYGFQIVEINRQEIDDIGISSTNIRNSLLSGNIKQANEFLGHEFTLTGKVVGGDKIGRKMGYPTANLQIAENYKLIPPDGVFAAYAEVKGRLVKGMLYIGVRPTVNGSERVIEINLFDFEEDIYKLEIGIHLIEKIRGDMKFDDLDSLKSQIDQDKIRALKILEIYENRKRDSLETK